MEITIQLDAEQERLLTDQGDPAAYIQALVDRETTRLWHIERSKPKEKVYRPAGARRLRPLEKEVRDKGDFLRNIYVKLHEFYGVEFPATLASQEAELEAAIGANDLNTLVKFVQEQPWQKRK